RLAQYPRNAEVEQLRLAGRVDQDVRRLQIAVDDQVAMRVRHRAADAEKKGEHVADRQALRIRIDRRAVDVFHDEIWMSPRGVAGVEESGDAGMLERR